MLFNSIDYIFFLPIVVIGYYFLPHRLRWILLFVSSCLFYMAFIPKYILVLFAIICIDYFAALWMEKKQGLARKRLLILSLLANIGILAFYKYFGFANQTLIELFALIGKEFKHYDLGIILPIGLSFHTFQSMSYTIEVYRGQQQAEKHLGYFANYVLFFPQMVAGPIERYASLGEELRKKQTLQYQNLSAGFRLVLLGFVVKMVVADNLAPFVNEIYSAPLSYNSWQIAIALLCFSFQIYADFFGYSLIAQGSARLLGINIMDNFKTPYFAENISEFWRRWHISLSTWFRDYLYISLGGNQVKYARWMLNTLLVFGISGLWHGANWTFIIWGLLHGFYIILEKPVKKYTNAIITFVFVSIAWVFFRAPNFTIAKDILGVLFSFSSFGTQQVNLWTPLLALALMFVLDLFYRKKRFDLVVDELSVMQRWGIYFFLIFILLFFSGTQKFTFIYFQF
jgi:D-alanyl-lipoteichoic acid acyltransferase DltB (MBOAT superfamily)